MKIDDKETSQRLGKFIEDNGGNVSAIARDCNLTIGHLGDIVRGAKRVSLNVLKALVHKKGLNPTWFFTGHGTMYLTGGPLSSNSQNSEPAKTLELVEMNNRLQSEVTDLLREKVLFLEQELKNPPPSGQEGKYESRKILAKYESKLKGLMKELGYSDEQVLGFINDKISLKGLFDDLNQPREIKRFRKKRERS